MMSIEKKLSALCASLLLAVFAGATGCEKDAPACDENETQQCACAGGMQGVQTCEDGEWGVCDCGGGGGSDSASGGSASASGGSASASGGSASDSGATTGASDGGSASDSGATTGASNSGTTGSQGPAVGDPCASPDACGAGQICVVQNGDDVQGICTVVCSDWADCTSDKIGQSFWDCCDLSNGSFACAPDTWECGG